MITSASSLVCLLAGTLALAPAAVPAHAQTRPPAAAKSKIKSSAGSRTKSHGRTSKRPARPPKSAVGISGARALQIQKALVQAGYLDHASGYWDAATRAAMARYQKDQHWQTRYVPDARALIALGLGPTQDPMPPQMDAAASAPSPAASAGR